MKIFDVRPQPYTKQLRCDRCGRLAQVGDDPEFHEFTSIGYTAGYGTIFGDGNLVEIDLCQRCLKDTLGPWLRVSDPDTQKADLQARLDAFDIGKHGGEFPAPADVPVQERKPI